MNVFDVAAYPDVPFRLSRWLIPDYAALITAMDVGLFIRITCRDADVCAAFFQLFQGPFGNVRRLRVTMTLPAVSLFKEGLDEFLALWMDPFEMLARSREWGYLDLAVPLDWYELLNKNDDAERTWTLSMTDWSVCPFFTR